MFRKIDGGKEFVIPRNPQADGGVISTHQHDQHPMTQPIGKAPRNNRRTTGNKTPRNNQQQLGPQNAVTTGVGRRKRKPKKGTGPGSLYAEIQQMKKNPVQLIMRKAPFIRLVREITKKLTKTDYRFQTTALLALQESSEEYLTGLFADANLLTLPRNRVTLEPKDMQLARVLRGEITNDAFKMMKKTQTIHSLENND